MLNIKNIGSFLQRTISTKHLGQKQLVCCFAKDIETKLTKKIVLNKKSNRQLTELKKQLAKKQPVKSEDLYSEYHFRDVYKRINIQMQSFFYERPYTVQNFNFLLNLISEQCPPDFKQRIEQVLQKMSLMNMKPDQKTYNYMIKAASNMKDPVLAQQYFKQACSSTQIIDIEFLPNKFLYTSLMQTYVTNNNPQMGLKILDEMIEKGLQPDIATYTTLINCFRKGRKLQKCWQVHKKMTKSKVQADETYTGVMLKVFAATHDAQKAIKLYKQNIKEKGIKPMIQTTNSYFKALSSRKQYSNHVVDKFLEMVEDGQIVTSDTANWALRACATIGNVRSAGEILKIMKIKSISIDVNTLSVLLKVYATACLVPDQQEKFRDIIITDSWKLLQQIDKMNGVNVKVLNNMLLIYANSINYQEIDGLILPLYQKYKQEYNMYTYEILIQMYFKLDDFTTAMRVWKQMNDKIEENKLKFYDKYDTVAQNQLQLNKLNEQIRPTFNALHCYLQIGIKMMDMKQVVQALKMFKQHKRSPKNATLKFLGNLQNLPEQIQVALMQFKIQFGKAKISKKQLPNIKDPQDQ